MGDLSHWDHLLACPDCGQKLAGETGGYRCAKCSKLWPVKDGVARFLEDHQSRDHLETVDGAAMAHAYRKPNALFQGLRKLITSEYFPGSQWRKAKESVLETSGPILVAGSGVTAYERAIHLDLDDFPGVDVVANAQNLPFLDESMTGVVCEVVLEHVAQATRIISETHRVLAPGGRFFFIVPFLFPFHGHPNDYRRWSKEGLLEEFSAFSNLEAGIHGGPCSAMVNLISEWFYVLTGMRWPKGYVPVKGAVTAALFPLKFLDYFVNRFPEAHRLAATLYITGVKA